MEIQNKNRKLIIGDDLPSGTFIPHSRFETVVNFVNDQNLIVYITSNRDLLASNAIFLPGVLLDETTILTISNDTIKINDLYFKRYLMDIYDSTFHFEDVDFTVFESSLVQILSNYSDLFPEKSLIFLLNPENEKFFTSGFDQHFMCNAKKSCELILAGEIVKGIENIRGTGYGLTPSGDDFIAGFFLGLHFNECKFKIDLSELREKIYHAAAGKNLLTNSFLKNAVNKKYFRPLKNVLLLLCEMTNFSFPDALNALLLMGATSGADLLTGYIYSIKHKAGI